jgi:hypothetical protein
VGVGQPARRHQFVVHRCVGGSHFQPF